MYDTLIIGNGMIGSAAARYLRAAGMNVGALGPDEPDDWQNHDGVFASHYDQGRITRIVDPDPVWATLAQRSIATYVAIEQASGVRFHFAAGCLRVTADPALPNDTLAQAEQNGRDRGAVLTRMADERLGAAFPFMHFPDTAVGLHEKGQAGYVNPRALVRAQLTVAAQQGAHIIRETAVALDRRSGAWEVRTDAGQTHRARRVLLATGAFTNGVLTRALDLRPKAQTVLLAHVSEHEAQRLAQMPSIIYRLRPHPLLYSIYALPPIRYPDGNVYVKIGGTFHDPLWFDTQENLRAWFHGAGRQAESDALHAVLLAMLPGLNALSFQTRPCVVTYTAHERPYVEQVADGLYVATGGCGGAAKSSDEIGRIAALLVENEGWAYDLEAALFGARYVV